MASSTALQCGQLQPQQSTQDMFGENLENVLEKKMQEHIKAGKAHPQHAKTNTPFGVKALQGQRPNMEDAYSVQMSPPSSSAPPQITPQQQSMPPQQADAQPPGTPPKAHPDTQHEAPEDRADAIQVPQLPEDLAVLSVFDGHGGNEVAEHCRESLHRHFAYQLSLQRADEDASSTSSADTQYHHQHIAEALRASFLSTDQELKGTEAGDFVGATAVVAVVGKSHIIIAHAGDSRAVIQRGGKAESLTRDHKPDREDEAARIKAAGGRVVFSNGGHRVMGMLAMSRAIGDHFLRPYVIANPEVTCVERTPQDEVLVLATDGLWDVFSCKEATTLAFRCIGRSKERGMSRHGACRVAASVLTKVALERGSRDNITVIVVDIAVQKQQQQQQQQQQEGQAVLSLQKQQQQKQQQTQLLEQVKQQLQEQQLQLEQSQTPKPPPHPACTEVVQPPTEPPTRRASPSLDVSSGASAAGRQDSHMWQQQHTASTDCLHTTQQQQQQQLQRQQLQHLPPSKPPIPSTPQPSAHTPPPTAISSADNTATFGTLPAADVPPPQTQQVLEPPCMQFQHPHQASLPTTLPPQHHHSHLHHPSHQHQHNASNYTSSSSLCGSHNLATSMDQGEGHEGSACGGGAVGSKEGKGMGGKTQSFSVGTCLWLKGHHGLKMDAASRAAFDRQCSVPNMQQSLSSFSQQQQLHQHQQQQGPSTLAAAIAADDAQTELLEAADHPTDMLPSTLPAPTHLHSSCQSSAGGPLSLRKDHSKTHPATFFDPSYFQDRPPSSHIPSHSSLATTSGLLPLTDSPTGANSTVPNREGVQARGVPKAGDASSSCSDGVLMGEGEIRSRLSWSDSGYQSQPGGSGWGTRGLTSKNSGSSAEQYHASRSSSSQSEQPSMTLYNKVSMESLASGNLGLSHGAGDHTAANTTASTAPEATNSSLQHLSFPPSGLAIDVRSNNSCNSPGPTSTPLLSGSAVVPRQRKIVSRPSRPNTPNLSSNPTSSSTPSIQSQLMSHLQQPYSSTRSLSDPPTQPAVSQGNSRPSTPSPVVIPAKTTPPPQTAGTLLTPHYPSSAPSHAENTMHTSAPLSAVLAGNGTQQPASITSEQHSQLSGLRTKSSGALDSLSVGVHSQVEGSLEEQKDCGSMNLGQLGCEASQPHGQAEPHLSAATHKEGVEDPEGTVVTIASPMRLAI